MPMLQVLLAERFHLVAQRESAERPVLFLVPDKDGPKLPPFGSAVSRTGSEGKVLFMVRHIPDLCERLGKVTGRPVIDKTGLDGDYQIELTYRPFGSAAGDPVEATFDVFSAVRSQLGL